jgi:hypothetical protein
MLGQDNYHKALWAPAAPEGHFGVGRRTYDVFHTFPQILQPQKDNKIERMSQHSDLDWSVIWSGPGVIRSATQAQAAFRAGVAQERAQHRRL